MISFRCLFVISVFATWLFPIQSWAQTLAKPHALAPAYAPNPLAAGSAARSKAGVTPQQELTAPYDCGHPTNEEQYLLELINRARANPPAEGVIVATTTDPDVLSEFKYWDGQDSYEPTPGQIRSDFANYPSVPPLAMNSSLLAAAHEHDLDMYNNDYEGHTGADGSTVQSRCAAQGYTGLYLGENVYAYGKSVWETEANFLIDFGPGNDTVHGHRKNILDLWGFGAYYTEVGPGILDGSKGSVGPMITTIDFGDAGKTFILGIAYNDNNHNNFYDIGEGDSGVTIRLSSGSYYAITSGSGGYAIPYSGPNGNVTVTASGGPFPAPVSKTIDFEGQNVKVDFNPDLTGYPTQATLVLPVADTTVNFDSVTFAWDSVALAQSYYIEIGTDSLFKSAIAKKDSGLKTTYFAFGPLKDSITYFWRVQAKNAKGVGPWSATQAFSVGLSPSPVVLIAPTNGAIYGDVIPTFIWHAANKGAQSYSIVVSSKSTMSDTVWSDNITDTTDQDGGAYGPGRTYYWTISAYNDFGWGRSSAPNSFSFSPLSVTSPHTNFETLSIRPNPAMGMARIYFTLATAQDVSLRLFNSVGDEVKSIALGTRSAGANEYDFDGSSLAAGTYSFELRVGNREEAGRIVLIK